MCDCFTGRCDVEGDTYYLLFPQTDGIDAEWVDGTPEIPALDALDQLTENRPTYKPALEMLAGEYDVDLDASQHDTVAGD